MRHTSYFFIHKPQNRQPDGSRYWRQKSMFLIAAIVLGVIASSLVSTGDIEALTGTLESELAPSKTTALGLLKADTAIN